LFVHYLKWVKWQMSISRLFNNLVVTYNVLLCIQFLMVAVLKIKFIQVYIVYELVNWKNKSNILLYNLRMHKKYEWNKIKIFKGAYIDFSILIDALRKDIMHFLLTVRHTNYTPEKCTNPALEINRLWIVSILIPIIIRCVQRYSIFY